MSGRKRLDSSLVGAAGEYHIASVLSMRGLIALLTIRNAPGIDLVAVNTAGTWHANIQIKTSQDKVDFWPVSTKYHEFSGPHNYYAFLRYIAQQARFEVFLETADRVIQDVDRAIAAGRARGLKDWAPCWDLPRDADGLARVRQQWEAFGQEVE